MFTRSVWKWAIVAAVVLLGTGAAIMRFTDRGADADHRSSPQGVVCFGRVDLEDGCTSLTFQQPGQVRRVHVHEGESVSAGKVLAELDDTTAELQEQEAQAACQAAHGQVELADQGVARHEAALEAQEAAIQAAESKHLAATEVHARKKLLNAKNTIDISEVNIAQQQVNEAQALVAAEKAKLKELKAQHPEAALERARGEEAAAQARSKLAKELRQQRTLHAPASGSIVRVLISQGDVLGIPLTHPAILFAADGPLIVRAEVEQEFASLVSVNQKVRVVDEINPTVAWHGHIERISNWYLPRRNVLLEPTRYNDTRTLECIVSLDRSDTIPRLGQQVRVLIGVPED